MHLGSVSGRVLLVPKGAFSPPSFIGKGPFIVMYSAGRVMRVCALHEARSISEDPLRSVVRTPRKMSHYPLLFSHYRGSLLSLSAAPELSLPLSFLALLLPRSFLRSPSSPAFTRVHPHSSLANPFSLELHAYTSSRSRVSPFARTRPREWRMRAQCLYRNQFAYLITVYP